MHFSLLTLGQQLHVPVTSMKPAMKKWEAESSVLLTLVDKNGVVEYGHIYLDEYGCIEWKCVKRSCVRTRDVKMYKRIKYLFFSYLKYRPPNIQRECCIQMSVVLFYIQIILPY